MAKRTPGPKLAIFNPWLLKATRGHWLKLSKLSPSPMYSVPWVQEWCIYGIIYHYAPILIRKPMVMVSGPNYSISNQVPKSITHFEGGLFSHSVLQSLAATRRRFKDPNHPAPQGLGCIFLSRIVPRENSGGYQASDQFSRHQVLQYSLDNPIGPYRLYSRKLYDLGPFGPIHIPSHRSILNMARSVLTQSSQYSQG
ncbi:hypothetical protein O181_062645 [Austropuccinia psidii MF-1]|uniref:Uncharacterized protein n=1 Tax=Austropuccinia psidii MF-1 TaxID=1389203 RepID=A0A9Q3EHC5_9BASI|nr:hypothetical protein [Austropuccinia psidii MF-1]